jgi:2-polyprenyl-6-methoxyphenol hydroxylase-like FAD-dependent oxidoreductase
VTPPNLILCQNTRVTGLVSVAEGSRVRVTGVTTASPEHPQIHADLVVDASGRNSKTLEWLATKGITPPEEEIIDSFSGYASRFYQLAPDPSRSWRGMVIDASIARDCRRWGVLLPIEHGRHVLTLGGINGAYPAQDEAGFFAHLRSLTTLSLAREIERAQPISGIHCNRSLWNRARHFETWKHDVGGFVVIGDSAVAFNPMHGQGMSLAAASANVLGDVCGKNPRADGYRLARSFQRAQWDTLRLAWNFATSIDMEWPGTTGKRQFGFNLELRLGNVVAHAAAEFPDVARLVGPVYQLVASPLSLLNPSLISLVLFAALRRRVGRELLLSEQPARETGGFSRAG